MGRHDSVVWETDRVGIYGTQILPRLIRRALDTSECRTLRARVVPRAWGRVLELGFGAGTNLGFYDAGRVDEVLAIDPDLTGFELSSAARRASPIKVNRVGLDGAAIELDDSSVDSVVSTWTLCTIPDVERALAESARVLKPGGQLLFVEHGRHPTAKVSRRQEHLDPHWGRVAGGCHLSRPIIDLVRGSPLEIEWSEELATAAPAVFAWHSIGAATRVEGWSS